MVRRYAILDDNQCLLEERIAWLRTALPSLVRERIAAAMVIGSVATGSARDDSDIDLVLVLRDGQPTRADYAWWDRSVRGPLEITSDRFPIQPVFVGRSALSTREPHLRTALETGFVLWDPQGVFHDQSQPRA